MPYSILLETDDIIAVDKPSGISISGDRWDAKKERLDKLLSEERGERLFIVHRIDCGASGILLFARNAEAHKKLSLAFEKRLIEKKYIAVVAGRPEWDETLCDFPVLPDANKKHTTIVEKFRGKKSRTYFHVLNKTSRCSVVEARPETGRQHQIRVHLAALGHPIVCDELYGSPKPLFLSSFKKGWRGDKLNERPLVSRLALHASEIKVPAEAGFAGTIVCTAPLHRDMKAAAAQIMRVQGVTLSS